MALQLFGGMFIDYQAKSCFQYWSFFAIHDDLMRFILIIEIAFDKG